MIRVFAVVFLLLFLAAPARAHVVESGADLRVTQTFGAGEVTLVIAGVSRVPAPLRVSAQAVAPSNLRLELELRSLTDGSRSTGSVSVGQQPAVLQALQTGPHELRVRAGDEVAVIPFRVLVVGAAFWEMLLDGAFVVVGLLLVIGVLAGRLSRPIVGGASAAAAVAAVVMLLEPHLSAAQPEGAAPRTGLGRPYAQGRFSTLPARPAAGSEFTLALRLTDGSTGRPVDDLAVHHEASAHLVVTSQDGAVFRHVHPLRTAPGVLAVRLRLPQPGRYLAYAEIERQESGGQLLSGAFEVSGAAQPYAPAQEPAAPRLTPPTPAAASPVTIEVSPEGPVQPWLGMPGHLIVRSADGVHLAHAHGTRTEGSALRFTLTLPEPGRYLAWAQYAAGGRLVTRPFTVEVAR
ncbi:MAG: hypothetical protein K0R62_2952 [Nonomuraea muscovyensis]|nr:hypothetical protein [Nonomuraea muscovyensis]